MSEAPRKTAIVTGAGSPRGIGSAAALRLASNGYNVALLDLDRRVDSTADSIAASCPEAVVTAYQIDITDPASVAEVVANAVNALGSLDVLVHSAGIAGAETDVVDLSVPDFDAIVDTNLKGTFLVAQAAAKFMKAAGSGSIITISSIFGIRPVPKTAAYSASKAGVIALTQAMAGELGPSGVRVNVIAPGYIITEMLEEKQQERAERGGFDLAGERSRVDAMIPSRRHGTPEDVAGAVLYLASDGSSYVTGWTIGVAGGVVMH